MSSLSTVLDNHIITPFRIFITVYTALTLPVCTLSTLLYVKRRNRHPLNARFTPLVLLTSTLNISQLIMMWLRAIVLTDKHCIMPTISHFLILTLQPFLYVFRAVLIYVRFAIADARLTNSSPSRFVQDMQSILSQPVKFRALTAGMCSLCLLPGAVILLHPSMYGEDAYGICTTFHSVFVDLAIVWVWVLVGLAIRSKLKDSYDYFWLKREILFVAVGTLGIGTAGVIHDAVLPQEYILYYFHGTLTGLVVIYGVHEMCSVIYPLWLSYGGETDARRVADHLATHVIEMPKSPLKMFEVFIRNEVGFQALMEYLVGEFCAENGLFLKRHREYVKLCNDASVEKLLAEARKIYTAYVVNGAPNQLNLSYEQVEYVENKLKAVEASSDEEENRRILEVIFTEIKDEVETLLVTGPWCRFSKTKLFLEAWQMMQQ